MKPQIKFRSTLNSITIIFSRSGKTQRIRGIHSILLAESIEEGRAKERVLGVSANNIHKFPLPSPSGRTNGRPTIRNRQVFAQKHPGKVKKDRVKRVLRKNPLLFNPPSISLPLSRPSPPRINDLHAHNSIFRRGGEEEDWARCSKDGELEINLFLEYRSQDHDPYP